MSSRLRGVPGAWLALAGGAALALAVGSGAARACLWDSDTLAAEVRGRLDVLRVITGRFERNPPLYYSLRLERVSARIASDPDDLEAYDDAGVACDRLGKGDEALDWMRRKAERLDAIEKAAQEKADPKLAARAKEHRYRLLANRGTFLVHRWLRSGADRSKIDEVKAARDDIAAALAINPDAHFGREAVQLRILEWIADPPAEKTDASGHRTTFLETQGRRLKHPGEDVKGLTGLVALGNAWESVDVFNALARALAEEGQRTSLVRMAQWRCEELIAGGKRSLLDGDSNVYLSDWMIRDEKALRETYRSLRAEAEAWQAKRTAYMVERLEEGRHPDTDRDFWSGFHDDGPPSIAQARVVPAARAVGRRVRLLDALLVLGFGGALTVLLVRLRQIRADRKARTQPGVHWLGD
ncbi:MAG: hypothetical protein U0835_04610 [Isosphaeraceae bacterium]